MGTKVLIATSAAGQSNRKDVREKIQRLIKDKD